MSGDEIVRTISDREVRISSPDKVYFPKVGLTKIDIVDYFLAVFTAARYACTSQELGRSAMLRPSNFGGRPQSIRSGAERRSQGRCLRFEPSWPSGSRRSPM